MGKRETMRLVFVEERTRIILTSWSPRRRQLTQSSLRPSTSPEIGRAWCTDEGRPRTPRAASAPCRGPTAVLPARRCGRGGRGRRTWPAAWSETWRNGTRSGRWCGWRSCRWGRTGSRGTPSPWCDAGQTGRRSSSNPPRRGWSTCTADTASHWWISQGSFFRNWQLYAPSATTRTRQWNSNWTQGSMILSCRPKSWRRKIMQHKIPKLQNHAGGTKKSCLFKITQRFA